MNQENYRNNNKWYIQVAFVAFAALSIVAFFLDSGSPPVELLIWLPSVVVVAASVRRSERYTDQATLGRTLFIDVYFSLLPVIAYKTWVMPAKSFETPKLIAILLVIGWCGWNVAYWCRKQERDSTSDDSETGNSDDCE